MCTFEIYNTTRRLVGGKRGKLLKSQVKKNVSEQRGKQSKAKRQKMYFIQCSESREAQVRPGSQPASQPVKWQVLREGNPMNTAHVRHVAVLL